MRGADPEGYPVVVLFRLGDASGRLYFKTSFKADEVSPSYIML